MTTGDIARQDDLSSGSKHIEAKLLPQRQKSMLQRTLLLLWQEFKSISVATLLTSNQFNGEIEKAKALWNALRKVAVAFSLSHSSVGVGGRDGGLVRTVCDHWEE